MIRYAVVPTHNRPEMLRECVEALAWQCHLVIIVDNASDPPVPDKGWPGNVDVEHDPTQPANLARLWNIQLDQFERAHRGGGRWQVAFVCDDVTVPAGWYQHVTEAMAETGAVAGSTHQYQPVGAPLLKRGHDSDIWNRMCGWAFVLDGQAGIRANALLKWWFLDTDVDWQARLKGGMVIAPGPVAGNRLPNDWTNRKPELGEQAGRDRESFREIWGSVPW